MRNLGCSRTIVAKKGYDEVVAQRNEVKRIAEEDAYGGIIGCYDRHEEELEDVEKGPDGEVGADGDLDKSEDQLGTYSQRPDCKVVY